MRAWLMISLLGFLLASCSGKRLNQRVSLWRNDKIPYGTYYAFSGLTHLFPYSDIAINKESPVRAGFAASYKDETDTSADIVHKSAIVIITPTFKPSTEELDALIGYVSSGNHVFISTFEPASSFLDSLRLSTNTGTALINYDDSLSVYLATDTLLNFSYPGKQLDNYINSFDSSITTVLGFDAERHPNFVRFDFKSEGSLSLQLAPLAFSNFFLLHGKNNSYYDYAMASIPSDIGKVYWDDYYRYFEYGEKKGSDKNKNVFSKLGVILKDDILRWALILTAVLFAMIYLFESKRKQRVIPAIQPLRNISLDFVKTIGRLYYQQRDNSDLVRKMAMQFADHMRTRYNFHFTWDQQNLVSRISRKTGFDQKLTSDILNDLQLGIAGADIDDDRLIELQNNLEQFYKHS